METRGNVDAHLQRPNPGNLELGCAHRVRIVALEDAKCIRKSKLR